MRLLSSRYLVLYYQGRGLPQLAQNLPLLTLPQEQVHSPAGLGEPHSEQNLPVFTAPQAHFHSDRKSTRLNSSHDRQSRMPSSA